jgi:adenosylmethionine-8-amino-7-oxononanoate aminotransferase
MPQLTEQPFEPLKEEGTWSYTFNYHALDVEVERAEGVFIYDTNGNRYYDASGGPMAVNLGHGHPRMKEAITEQLDKYCYVHPTLANRRRADLCEEIASVTPEGINASYLVSGGSEAVETALKIARQYHVATGNPGKHKIISCYESYHGMTLATMALSGHPGTLRHYDPMIQKWPKIYQYSDVLRPDGVSRDDWALQTAHEIERLIAFEGPATVAAFIATPHGCGSDYGVVAPKLYWQEIRRICDEYDVLLIDDEVVTGFGRTGQWFGIDHHGVLPDLMTFAKGISSSNVPLGAVAVSDRVNEPFHAGVGFVHGFTNGGNALACAAGIATIEILKSENLIEQSRIRGEQLFSHTERLLAHPSVADVRGWGLFMVLELVSGANERAYFPRSAQAELRFQQVGLSNGLVFYSTLYGNRRAMGERGLPMWISPPLTITEDELADMVDRLDQTLTDWESAMGI